MTYSEYRAALAEEANDFNAGLTTCAQYRSNVNALMAEWREQRKSEDFEDRYCDASGACYSDADSGL